MKGTAGRVFTSAVTMVVLLGAAVPGRTSSSQSPGPAAAKQIGVPQTAQEHLTLAASYQEKAAAYRQEAETHRKMFADYEKAQGNPALQSKMGKDLPWIAKMRKHCGSFIRQAEALAAEAESFAEFHRMRAEELKGK